MASPRWSWLDRLHPFATNVERLHRRELAPRGLAVSARHPPLFAGLDSYMPSWARQGPSESTPTTRTARTHRPRGRFSSFGGDQFFFLPERGVQETFQKLLSLAVVPSIDSRFSICFGALAEDRFRPFF